MRIEENNLKDYSPTKQLSLLKLQCNRLSPEIYKNHALYIQIIRKILKGIVRDVVFTIYIDSIELDNQYSRNFSKESLQKKIDDLIDKTNSMLTIEHLLDLSRQIEEELKLNQEKARNQIITAIDEAKTKKQPIEESVELTINPPIQNQEGINEWLPDDFQQRTLFDDESEKFDQPEFINEKLDENIPAELSADQGSDSRNYLFTANSQKDIFRSIFLMASEAFSKDKDHNNISSDEKEVSNKMDKQDKNFLPDNPKQLIKWSNSIDQALNRRLINLSHAINIELLRSGILNTLLPLNLLEAVAKGQIETLYSNPNLLKIRIPLQGSIIDEGMELSCVLLRPSEFEFENLALRRCRLLIKQNKVLLNKMLKQYTHWQGRLITKDEQKKWWQNP